MTWRQEAAALLIMASGVAVGVQLQAEYDLVDSEDPRSVGASSAQASAGPGREARPRPSREARRKRWPFKLRRAPRRLPVQVEFARRPKAGILFDVETGEVLWQRHPHRRLPVASLTKILTALILVERHRPREKVKITREALAYEGSGMGVLPKKGKRVSLESLLNGLLLVSGNDAAIALAQQCRQRRRIRRTD